MIVDAENHLTFWRTPTSNDIPVDAPYWQRFGLDKMTTRVSSVVVRKEPSKVEIVVVSYMAPPILAWGFESTAVYTVTDGRMSINTHIKPTVTKNMIPEKLSRIGWELTISEKFVECNWFGRGPGESYADKKSGTQIGIFKSKVADLDYRYEVPQKKMETMKKPDGCSCKCQTKS